MFEHALTKTTPFERREAINDELDNGYLLTDILLLDDQIKTEALEAIGGWYRNGGSPQKEPTEQRPETFKFRTVDGKPLKGIKVGLRGMTTREELRLNQLGKEAIVRRDFPPEFEVPMELAVLLLREHGYGFCRPRFYNRHCAQREEVDCFGNKVKPVDRWKLVEVGSQFDDQARQEFGYEKKERSSGKHRS